MMQSARFWRIAFLAQALIVGLVILFYQRDWLPLTKPVGMTETPCRANGIPATGKAGDDWAGLCFFHADNARIKATGVRPRAVFIGDSHTAFWPLADSRLFAPEIINRGIGSQTSSQLLLRFEQDVVALRPDVVHILIGINDVAGLTGPISLDQYQANIRAMVDLAQANGIAVILATVPAAQMFPERQHIKPMPWQAQINRWLIALAEERGLTVADYAKVVNASEGVVRPEFYKDAIHLNAQGYAAIYQTAQQALAEAEAKAKEAPER
jgi:lysophospholipase L1-like esterase